MSKIYAPGSYPAAFASNLGSRRNLTIVTNNVAMVSASPYESIKDIYILGGNYRVQLGSTVGRVGFGSGSISVDTAIIGVSSLTVSNGLSTTVLEEASMLAQMIACARRTVVVADGSKFGVSAFAQIAQLTAIDVLVTDTSPLAIPEPAGEASTECEPG